MKSLLLALGALSFGPVGWASPVAALANEHVAVYEEALAAGQREAPSAGISSVTIFLTDGRIRLGGDSRAVKRGEVIYRDAVDGPITAAAAGAIRLVRIELKGAPSAETWGQAGLPSNYRIVAETPYVRAYDVRIPAGASEPLHTHHDRVVVCLSGAQLRHELPDGRTQASTMQTGQIAWRQGQTHVGHNIGATDFWAICVEPK
ncbi:MAG TPA: hypothetical protein VHV47_15100 [Opitutaceae bacterium]|jgi:quercetin dioxygenase-like cupin family protein|nr:hypothetical protein [Opitutaceae bacterium]